MAYIVCKAPTENVKEAFWKMILEQKCTIIVLLSKWFMTEQSDDNYCPKNDWQHVSEDVKITSRMTMYFDTHWTTDVDIQTPNGDRRVMVLHFTGGFKANTGDMTTASFANFLTHVRTLKKAYPQLVCSSDGLSLCGIFVALDTMVADLESTNIVECVRRLLQQRPDLIQTADEYEFIHKALVSSHKNMSEKKEDTNTA